MQAQKLILIYNGDMSLKGGLEYVGQLLRKAPSECALCDITHHTVREKGEWQQCRVDLGLPIETHYRNKLSATLQPFADQLPCVLVETSDGIQMLLDRDVLATCQGEVAKLESLIRERFESLGISL